MLGFIGNVLLVSINTLHICTPFSCKRYFISCKWFSILSFIRICYRRNKYGTAFSKTEQETNFDLLPYVNLSIYVLAMYCTLSGTDPLPMKSTTSHPCATSQDVPRPSGEWSVSSLHNPVLRCFPSFHGDRPTFMYIVMKGSTMPSSIGCTIVSKYRRQQYGCCTRGFDHYFVEISHEQYNLKTLFCNELFFNIYILNLSYFFDSVFICLDMYVQNVKPLCVDRLLTVLSPNTPPPIAECLPTYVLE